MQQTIRNEIRRYLYQGWHTIASNISHPAMAPALWYFGNDCRMNASRYPKPAVHNIYAHGQRTTQEEMDLDVNIQDAVVLTRYTSKTSSRMRVLNHYWSATKQRPHPQSVAEISRHSVLSGDRIQQCETPSGSRRKDTDQCL